MLFRIIREDFMSDYRMMLSAGSISTMLAIRDGLAAKDWTLIWQSGEMNLSDARKRELLLKRQKGGKGFYRLIGLPQVGS